MVGKILTKGMFSRGMSCNLLVSTFVILISYASTIIMYKFDAKKQTKYFAAK
jgi:hypothetical protein